VEIYDLALVVHVCEEAFTLLLYCQLLTKVHHYVYFVPVIPHFFHSLLLDDLFHLSFSTTAFKILFIENHDLLHDACDTLHQYSVQFI
jgi:hypothetical protein